MWAIYQVSDETQTADHFHGPFETYQQADKAVAEYWRGLISRQLNTVRMEYAHETSFNSASDRTVIDHVFFNGTPDTHTRDAWIKATEDIHGSLASHGCDELEELVYDIGEPACHHIIRDLLDARPPFHDTDDLPVLVAAQNGYRVTISEFETYYILEVPNNE